MCIIVAYIHIYAAIMLLHMRNRYGYRNRSKYKNKKGSSLELPFKFLLILDNVSLNLS